MTDGSLSSCPPAEAVTWGKVDKDHHRATCESVPGDYSMLMPLVTKALLDKRAKLAGLREELGEETLFERHPEARGYLRDPDGYRLFDIAVFSGTSRSGRWVVVSATRRPGAASIITTRGTPARSAGLSRLLSNPMKQQ